MPDTYDEVLDSAQLALLQTLRNHLMHYAIFASPERRIYLFWKFSPDELTLPSDLLDDNVIATRFVRKAEQIVCATLVESPFLFPKLILPLADQQLDMPSR